MKMCHECGEWKPRETGFYRTASRCKPCHNVYTAARDAANPEDVKARMKRHNAKRYQREDYRERSLESARRSKLKNRYGLTPDEYDEMFEAQSGRCAICGSPPEGKRLSVDHDHQTDEVRGLLCQPCNLVLGSVEALLLRCPEAFERVKEYLCRS